MSWRTHRNWRYQLYSAFSRPQSQPESIKQEEIFRKILEREAAYGESLLTRLLDFARAQVPFYASRVKYPDRETPGLVDFPMKLKWRQYPNK